MTPRPRGRLSVGLPPNLYPNNNGTTFKYRRPDTGEWFGMGGDRQKAIAAAKKLNSLLLPSNDLVTAVIGAGVTVREFLEIYATEILPSREYAQDTIDLFETRRSQINAVLGDRAMDSITISDVADLVKPFGPRSANQIRSRLIDVFNHAAARGIVVDNPAVVTIAKLEKRITQRHTAAGLKKIRMASPLWMQNAIDLGLITAQRREDITRMRFDGIEDGYMYVVQLKTRRSSDAGWLQIKITPELQAVINRCRDDVPSPYLIHRRPDIIKRGKFKTKDHWTQVTDDYLTHAFQEIRDGCGAYNHLPMEERPGFHQIRALSQKLYELAGKDPQKIAGLTTKKMSKNYTKDHDEITWTEVAPDLDITRITG